MASVAKIKKSLLKQLENSGADVDHFNSLIDDYIWFCKEERVMQKDIKKRGHFIDTNSASGFPIQKENPSIKNAIMYSKQKLAILKELGLKTDNVIDDEDEEL